MKTIFSKFYSMGQSLMYQGVRAIYGVKYNKILVKKTFFSGSNNIYYGRNFLRFYSMRAVNHLCIKGLGHGVKIFQRSKMGVFWSKIQKGE